ncbi:Uncharacterised protein [uncultured Anaerotruncus sp.]|uniref:Uncharacterized protein n=1 Tax=uncultured Anaerotruncus sp. TaxID=905011 RepID=A0A6N2SLZ4_9FIRM
MPAPCTPGTSFYADKRKQNPPGRPRSPLSVRHNGNARKIFSRCACTPEAHPHLERKIFPLMRMPSRRCKEPIFLGSCPKQRGVLRGHSQQVGRSGFSCAACSSAPLKCAFRQGFLSHKNPCASVWARAHISPPQDGILNKGRCRAGRLHNRRPWGQELPPPPIFFRG